MKALPERIRIKDIARLADVSVGTVDRVIHGRGGVSKKSQQRVEEILKQLDYQPNMYASALASNKRYTFCCFLPKHREGEYWTDIEKGIADGVKNYSDFNISLHSYYYDPYDYTDFTKQADTIVSEEPDGVILAPTAERYTLNLVNQLIEKGIPFIYLDSYFKNVPPLAFYGQHSNQSGYFAARMLMLLNNKEEEIVIFRKIHEGIVGSNQQESRERGFRQYMKAFHPNCTINELNLPADPSDKDNEMLMDFFQQHPNITSGITFNSKAYIIANFLKEHQIKPFNLIGYDLLEENVSLLKEGYIQFLIAQKPELQGFNSIKALCNHLILKKNITCINYMPIDLLTAETIDFYSNN